MDYIYNERTGDFKTTSQVVWSILLWPFRWSLAPFRLFMPLLRLLAVPFAFMKRQFPKLVGVLVLPFIIVWRIVKTVVRWVSFPAIKWWEVERTAISEGDWFLAVIWIVPGLLVYVIYKPFFFFTLWMLWSALLWVLKPVFLLVEYIKGMFA